MVSVGRRAARHTSTYILIHSFIHSSSLYTFIHSFIIIYIHSFIHSSSWYTFIHSSLSFTFINSSSWYTFIHSSWYTPIYSFIININLFIYHKHSSFHSSNTFFHSLITPSYFSSFQPWYFSSFHSFLFTKLIINSYFKSI